MKIYVAKSTSIVFESLFTLNQLKNIKYKISRRGQGQFVNKSVALFFFFVYSIEFSIISWKKQQGEILVGCKIKWL